MSLTNIASAGVFAADRAIEEYANWVWKIEKH
jgi:glucan phosphorylase